MCIVSIQYLTDGTVRGTGRLYLQPGVQKLHAERTEYQHLYGMNGWRFYVQC